MIPRMYLARFQLLTNLGAQDKDFLLCPCKTSTEQLERESLKPFEQLNQVTHPKVPEMYVLGPGTIGDLEGHVVDVDEVGVILYQVFKLGTDLGVASEYLACVHEGVSPALDGGVLERAVVALEHEAPVLKFGPTARIEISGHAVRKYGSFKIRELTEIPC